MKQRYQTGQRPVYDGALEHLTQVSAILNPDDPRQVMAGVLFDPTSLGIRRFLKMLTERKEAAEARLAKAEVALKLFEEKREAVRPSMTAEKLRRSKWEKEAELDVILAEVETVEEQLRRAKRKE